jgi:metallophosphoesterase superfamily enzyme
VRLDADWLLTPERVAVHLPSATLVIADLHLGYSAARRASGEAVPLPDLAALLAPLAAVAGRTEARRLVVAGELFEAGCSDSLLSAFLDQLRDLDLELAGIVPGNHDRGLESGGLPVPLYADGFPLGGWHVVHGDGELPAGPVVHGHIHPCLRWRGIAAPCFLLGPGRLVLPAFSRDAAGANVLRDQRWRGYRCLAPAGDRVLDFGLLGKPAVPAQTD